MYEFSLHERHNFLPIGTQHDICLDQNHFKPCKATYMDIRCLLKFEI